MGGGPSPPPPDTILARVATQSRPLRSLEQTTMPSPFPGMDPYLEHPETFPGLHDDLISQMKGALQQRLPEPYYATSQGRVWIEMSHRYVEPDVDVLRPREGSQPEHRSNGPAVLAPPTARGRSVLVRVPHDEHRENFLDIYAQQDNGDRLVTTVEVLSPSNKTPGEHGRELYLRKQKEIPIAKSICRRSLIAPTTSDPIAVGSAIRRRLQSLRSPRSRRNGRPSYCTKRVCFPTRKRTPGRFITGCWTLNAPSFSIRLGALMEGRQLGNK
jgi:hypothetical protein